MGEVFAARYELADPIGRGGVGAVWRAWDHRRRRYVAAKVLQQSDAHALLRFVREQALRIDHPHVLAPASWAADDDKVLFTMDLVAGGSLVHLVGDYGPLPPLFVCTLIDQLLSGLSAVHAEGVVHRDIKPANILLEATGTARPRLRLSDFGIAMRLGEPRLTETNLVVGTPGYLAPEQMMGAEPDFPADLFAVGLVALYLLEGAKPDAKALLQYFAEHGTPGAPKGVPEPLWQVVATLLQPDPQARFRTATGARKALAAAVELLPEPGPDDEQIEIFDQLGPLPQGFGPQGPSQPAPGPAGAPPPSGRTSPQQDITGSTPARPGGDPLPAWPGTGSVTSGIPAPPPGPPPVPPSASAPVPPPAWTPVPSAEPGPGAGAAPHGAGADDAVASGSDLPGGSGTGASRAQAPPPPSSDPRNLAHTSTGGPRQPLEASSAGPGRAMSDTGSFPPSPPPGAPLRQAPAHGAPGDATFVLPPRPAAEQRVDTSTASYTAQDPQVPPAAPLPPPPAAPERVRRRGHRRARAARRPGPPAKVALPLLLLALVCYAVGFWALARI
ncbi:serine/threonine protein kinase [Streptomyces phaeoluteigriseus]|uniref:non-specific serine/threonine protein kinase n=1 Tax=Streptomyces phaeoluteigriseus TaxID=114686 RepID=A0A1V6MLH3_9ACTN|nr:serine/threonine-protein kinase [Streptomyces phaeoluteigriseus]OQD53329.1 serine/threonine protein kinase [Streptomyces phaeoluteigriseus]